MEWGLDVMDVIAPMAWGARAIITTSRKGKRGIDIPWDRQSFSMGETKMDKDDFVFWINNTAIKEIERRVQKYDTKNIRFSSDSGHFHCVAEDKSSGGYLYITCWSDI